MLQQGLTANVSCRAIDSSRTQFLWDTNNSNVIDTGAAFRLWKITANCGASEFRPHISCLELTVSSQICQ
jgi:hypothetical protein